MQSPVSRRPTYLRQWREYRRISLRQLADRINAGRPDALISYVSLGRIERGIQPYSQDVLEAVADALDAEPAALLSQPPDAGPGIYDIWLRLDAGQRRLAIALLQALMHAG